MDLWTGQLRSSFEVDGQPVQVQTAAHPDRDEVGIHIQSPLITSGHLKVRIAFPYASGSFGPDYQDWTHPDAHQTVMTPHGNHAADFAARWTARTTPFERHGRRAHRWLETEKKHQFLLSSSSNSIDLAAWFSSGPITAEVDSVPDVQKAAAEHWQHYWMNGGALDLSGNDDPRAAELERRIVLSQYVMAVHDGGSLPPQETGLAVNSWYGKFHMEMYWWHTAHFALWGRPEILEKSLSHLPAMMPPVKRWQKEKGAKV